MNEDAIKSRIAELAEERWNSGKGPLLLAQIGQIMAKEGVDIQSALKGRRMRAFVQEELGERLQVVQSPTDKLVFGVIPASVEQHKDVFSAARAEARERDAMPRYAPPLWIAFVRELPAEKRRIVAVGDEISFRDVDAGTPIGLNEYEVKIDQIVADHDLPKPKRDAMVMNNIRQWLAANGINENLVLAKNRSTKASSTESLLSALLDSLDDTDLKRLTLPLDVVKKLQRTKLS